MFLKDFHRADAQHAAIKITRQFLPGDSGAQQVLP
jgi:hypothetical protein